MNDWRKILIAVNDSDDALRAVRYVGQVAQSTSGLSIHLLCVFPDPPPDFYDRGGTDEAYNEIMKHQGREALHLAISNLEKFGVDKESIITRIELANGKTISQVILDTLNEYQCNTLVVGKRGISRNEEFLFGSISNTIARKTDGFTTWIIS